MPEKQSQRYRQVVDHVAGLAQQMTNDPPRIQYFCRVAGVSPRMLRRAFHHVHGTSPCRYIRRLRMNQVRKALSSASSLNVTITHVATDFGFVELGRFSVEYRAIFGECPSATLRRALASQTHINARRAGSAFVQSSDRSRAVQLHEVGV